MKTYLRMKNGLVFIALIVVFLLPAQALATTYYVRPDGGSSSECTGLSDAAYPGTGSGQNCAFSHPFYVIAVQGNNTTRMEGGDTLIIDGSNNAQYKMGWGAPNISDTSICYSAWPWSCFMRSVPSGPDAAHPTRVLGKGWDTGCANPPELWGTERASMVFNLSGSSNVEVQCLDITDHSACQEHGPNPCNRDSIPYGDWATTGLVATDSENVLLKNVNIHGMAYRGIYAGRLKDWTIEDTRIVSNSFVGWDGDVGAYNSSNSGTMTFTGTSILFSGCGETYPGLQPYNCYSQDQGGYGDGLGTHSTGADWVFTNCDLSHNVSDGLDLLYHNGNGTITINRSRFEGNAGNQVKTGANAVIANSLIIGNCAYFANSDKTWNTSGFNNCRAGGNAVAMAFDPGTDVLIYNSTISSNGDTVLQSAGGNCDGTETLVSRNNIYLGGTEYNDGSDLSAIYWAAGETGNGDGPCGAISLDDDYSVIYNTKYYATDCNGKANSVCADPKFNEPTVQYYSGDAFDAGLQSSSPAREAAQVLTGKSGLDYNSYDRGAAWDIGALEYGSIPQEAPEEEPDPTCADGIQYCASQGDCEGQGYYWYDNICNSEPEPEPTCADGIQYCASQGDCEGQGYYWYDNICNSEPEPEPTCVDGIQYCTTQGDCEGQGYYWYDNTCNAVAEPEPEPTCADGIQYCTTQGGCEGQGYYWYNNTCNAVAEPEPEPTCADGIQYCSTQGDCEGQGYYWYNNTCNAVAEPEPDPTCADGIQYCTTQGDCEGQGYYWYNNTCNAVAEPEPEPTCADGIQYCTTQGDCEGQGYYWYNNTCNAVAEPEPEPTCADGIQYCTTQNECELNGYYWYSDGCHEQEQVVDTNDGTAAEPEEETSEESSTEPESTTTEPAPDVTTPQETTGDASSSGGAGGGSGDSSGTPTSPTSSFPVTTSDSGEVSETASPSTRTATNTTPKSVVPSALMPDAAGVIAEKPDTSTDMLLAELPEDETLLLRPPRRVAVTQADPTVDVPVAVAEEKPQDFGAWVQDIWQQILGWFASFGK